MYKRILVPLDGSPLAEQVLPYVRFLARGFHCPVTLLRAVEAPPNISLTDPGYGMYQNQSATLRLEAREYVARIAESMKQDGLEVSSVVQVGNPALAIINEATKEPATLITMSTHGRSGIMRWFLGSVTDRVLHATRNPLLIIRVQEESELKQEVRLDTVIVPLDGSSLAEQVLPHVAPIAKALGLKVALVRITPVAAEFAHYIEYVPAPYLDLAQDVDEEASTYLHRINRGLKLQGVANVEEHVLHGHPAVAIVDFARSISDNMVAMSSHGRSGIGSWLLGSITGLVARHCGDPVLVIRPTEEGTDGD